MNPRHAGLILAIVLAAPPVGAARAQVPQAADPHLAAYVGRTCSHAFRNTTNFDEFLVRNGNIAVHHRTRDVGQTEDQGIFPLHADGDGTYSYTTLAGSLVTYRTQPTPDSIGVTLVDGHGRGTSRVRYSCAPT